QHRGHEEEEHVEDDEGEQGKGLRPQQAEAAEHPARPAGRVDAPDLHGAARSCAWWIHAFTVRADARHGIAGPAGSVRSAPGPSASPSRPVVAGDSRTGATA